MIINISKDFSPTPGGRYTIVGPFSGELFRDSVLEPQYLKCLYSQEKLVINFDGGYGYASGFLEEIFGGMVRKGYVVSELLSVMEFVSLEEPHIVADILTYMREQEAIMSRGV